MFGAHGTVRVRDVDSPSEQVENVQELVESKRGVRGVIDGTSKRPALHRNIGIRCARRQHHLSVGGRREAVGGRPEVDRKPIRA